MPELRSSLSAKFWTILLAMTIVLVFVISYWNELRLAWQLISVCFLALFFHVNVTLPINADTIRACVIIGLNLIVFIFGFLFALLWVSQFTLPVRSHSERLKAFDRLLLYTLAKKLHGPAIFIKKGKPKAEEGELNNLHEGVVFVDLNSAIVLEQQSGSTAAVRQEVHFDLLPDESAERKSHQSSFWKKILNSLGLTRNNVDIMIVRTFGPGIVFTKLGEKIVGWADLRKQTRTRTKVQGSTRDGIEITTNISVTFTLGQSEDTLKITKVGSDWLVIQTSPASGDELKNNPDLRAGDLVVKLLLDHLSDEDMKEVDRVFDLGDIKRFESGMQVVEQKSGSVSQFTFDAERVFAAVYSRARQAKDGILGEWTDLPVHAATEVFRGLLVHENYDDLYLPDEPEKFPLPEFKARFGRIVRNMGILGYQIVIRKDGKSLKDGQVWNVDGLIFSQPMRFQGSAVLRDRGIKVLSASFSELIPANEIVRAQLLENWRAHWQRETQKTLADHELRTIRIHNHERARTQQDMIYSLSRIFQDGQYTDEALAMRLYQALEVAATNPATQRLLPSDTVQMLSNLRQWLLSDDKHTKNDSDDVEISTENSQ